MKEYCNGECNDCKLLYTPNAKILTRIFNEALEKFGNDFYHIVQNLCPNLTCCFDCHIDDFCHIEGCKIVKGIDENTDATQIDGG